MLCEDGVLQRTMQSTGHNGRETDFRFFLQSVLAPKSIL